MYAAPTFLCWTPFESLPEETRWPELEVAMWPSHSMKLMKTVYVWVSFVPVQQAKQQTLLCVALKPIDGHRDYPRTAVFRWPVSRVCYD